MGRGYDELLDNIDPARDVKIDKFNLDEEAKRLPTDAQRYYEILYRHLTPKLNDEKFQLEKEEAVARKDIRLNIANQEGRKPTKDDIESELNAMPSIIDLRRRVRSLETQITYYKGVLAALDMKKSSLNNLVSLYIKEYYSTDKADDGRFRRADVAFANTDGNDYDDYRTSQNKKLNQAIKRKRKKEE